MRQLIWSHPARRDLYKIARYYGQFDPDLPLKILERIGHAPLLLLDYPEIGSPTARRGVRKWKVDKTEFILLYAARSDRIEIRRVRHASMNWREGDWD